MIIFEKTLKLLNEKGVSTYRIRKDNVISQSALYSIKNGGSVDLVTINKLCKYLNCQPSDLMEYVPDNEDNKELVKE